MRKIIIEGKDMSKKAVGITILIQLSNEDKYAQIVDFIHYTQTLL